MQVVKRDGSIEEFNVDKIISAVEKAFKSCNKKMPQYLYDMLGALFGTLEGDTIGIEEIQNKVEDVLMNDKHFDVAKKYIIYREQLKQARFIRERIDYMNEYKQNNNESKGHLCHFDSLLVSKSFSISILRFLMKTWSPKASASSEAVL